MADSKRKSEPIFWMTGSYSVQDLEVRRAIVKEKLSTLTDIRIEFQSEKTDVDIEKLLGQTMSLHLNTTSKIERKFHGTCVSVENLGLFDGYLQLVAEVRPWPWFLNRTTDSRIFQEMTVKEIIEKIFSDSGFSDYKFALTETYPKRNYCVQYRESDFDFISRLMEEEGMYYWFDQTGSSEIMNIVDYSGGHKPIEGTVDLEYRPRSDSATGEYVAEFTEALRVRSGKVTLDDYHFATPKSDLKSVALTGRTAQKHSHKDYELYDVPGKYRIGDAGDTAMGNRLADAIQQAEDTESMQFRGAGNVPRIAAGRTFKLKDHEHKAYNQEYLVSEAVHYIQTDADYKQIDERRDLDLGPDPFPEDMAGDVYNCTFGVRKKTSPYRAMHVTPWPKIAGLHTATVVGKAGEEIWTDKHGRIKVQFHWDREGKKDEKSSCWVRVVTPWSGKNWGMIHIPRIGQEVVIQFEEGYPDRPICTGMLYNADTMPPYALPANQTQSGIKTNSSKGGGGYNELMFEDKKGEELVRFQAEKDYKGLVKNHSTVTVGHDSLQNPASGAGDHHQTVKNNVVETINDGDRTFTIETGSEIVDIKTDKNVTIHNNKLEVIENNNTRKVTGDDNHTIDGNQGIVIGKSQATTVGESIGTTAGDEIVMTAGSKLELVCGSSKITLTKSKIEIKAKMIDISADVKADMKSKMTSVKATAKLTLNGKLTMIN